MAFKQLCSTIDLYISRVLNKTNGIYQHTATSDYVYLDNLTAGADSALYYSSLSSLSTPSLSNTRTFYQPAEKSGNSLYIYGTKAHLEQTWSGKATDDILITYNTNLNSGDPGADMTSYRTQSLRVSGL